MDTQRIIALVVFMFSGMLLWEAWNKHNAPPPVVTSQVTSAAATQANKGASAVPTVGSLTTAAPGGAAATSLPPDAQQVKSTGKRISIVTDTLAIDLDTQGGEIRRAILLKQRARGDVTRPFTLMQDKAGAYFVAQSGLLGQGFPNHLAMWNATSDKYVMDGTEKLDVVLTNTETPGLAITKTLTFTKGSYVVDVRYDIKNNTDAAIAPIAYFQFLHDGNPPEGESAGSMFSGVVTFTGPAFYTELKKYQKVDFSSIDKNKQEYVKDSNDGWVAMVQHYFVSAWLPADKLKREFFATKVSDKLYSAGVKVAMPAAAAGATTTLDVPLYLGPQEQDKLEKLAPGLDLVVDYGWLKPLAYPMFAVLSWLNKIIGNWGWTIVIFTILLKLVFFPLNQKAGKSMAHMKLLAPKVEALKTRHGDDKMKLNQAMMELYKTEKINPLGGCLPILIQMPFLIAMYWVLLGAVELRNTPWIGWITDLSTPDPWYVLPVIMGVSMLIQTKLNPAPPDPVQAKVMLMMPIVFSVMFFFFPAGLVLYWTMQNILGIFQQWYINKSTAQITQPKLAR